jgi:3' exoribonuclease, RNase T-like
MKHIMLDLETLGTGNTAAIVAIGACEFDLHGEGVEPTPRHQLYVPITPESAIKAGLVVDGSTIRWWLQQSDAARKSTFPDDALDLHTACSYLCGFVEQYGKDVAVWGNGATFDNVIIRSAFKAVGLPVPWSFRNDKCYRTAVNLLPEARRPEFVRSGTAHNALDDAITQAIHLQKCIKELGI